MILISSPVSSINRAATTSMGFFMPAATYIFQTAGSLPASASSASVSAPVSSVSCSSVSCAADASVTASVSAGLDAQPPMAQTDTAAIAAVSNFVVFLMVISPFFIFLKYTEYPLTFFFGHKKSAGLSGRCRKVPLAQMIRSGRFLSKSGRHPGFPEYPLAVLHHGSAVLGAAARNNLFFQIFIIQRGIIPVCFITVNVFL